MGLAVTRGAVDEAGGVTECFPGDSTHGPARGPKIVLPVLLASECVSASPGVVSVLGKAVRLENHSSFGPAQINAITTA